MRSVYVVCVKIHNNSLVYLKKKKIKNPLMNNSHVFVCSKSKLPDDLCNTNTRLNFLSWCTDAALQWFIVYIFTVCAVLLIHQLHKSTSTNDVVRNTLILIGDIHAIKMELCSTCLGHLLSEVLSPIIISSQA